MLSVTKKLKIKKDGNCQGEEDSQQETNPKVVVLGKERFPGPLSGF